MVNTHIVKAGKGLLGLILLCGLYGCQSTAQNSKIIATAFNMTTAVQQKIMDRYAPDDVIVQQNILYDSDRRLGLDLYQP